MVLYQTIELCPHKSYMALCVYFSITVALVIDLNGTSNKFL